MIFEWLYSYTFRKGIFLLLSTTHLAEGMIKGTAAGSYFIHNLMLNFDSNILMCNKYLSMYMLLEYLKKRTIVLNDIITLLSQSG